MFDRLFDRLADEIGEAFPVGGLQAGRDQFGEFAHLLPERADRFAEGLPVGAFHCLAERGAEPFAELLPELFEAIPVDFAVGVLHVLELLRPGVPFLFVEGVLEGGGELLAPFLPALADLFPVLAVGLPVGVLEAAAEALAPFLPALTDLFPALVMAWIGLVLRQECTGNEGDQQGESQCCPAMVVKVLHMSVSLADADGRGSRPVRGPSISTTWQRCRSFRIFGTGKVGGSRDVAVVN